MLNSVSIYKTLLMLNIEKQKNIMKKSFFSFPLHIITVVQEQLECLFIGFYSLRHQNESVWNSNEVFISKRNHILQHLNFIIQDLSIQHLKM